MLCLNVELSFIIKSNDIKDGLETLKAILHTNEKIVVFTISGKDNDKYLEVSPIHTKHYLEVHMDSPRDSV